MLISISSSLKDVLLNLFNVILSPWTVALFFFFSNSTFNISKNNNPIENHFDEGWITLPFYPSFPEPFFQYLLTMANHPPSSQKCTPYLVPLFQDVWQHSTIANISCKAKKREWGKIEYLNIRA